MSSEIFDRNAFIGNLAPSLGFGPLGVNILAWEGGGDCLARIGHGRAVQMARRDTAEKIRAATSQSTLRARIAF
jgi:hypothetical protein